MLLLVLMCFFSFACLLVSLVALSIVLKSTYFKGDNELTSSPSELVVITGCDSGIGLELAKYIHGSTNYTLLCGFLRANPSVGGHKELKKLASSGPGGGPADGRLILSKLDITCEEDLKALEASLVELKGAGKIKRVAALINNAGVMAYGEFDWLTWAQIDSQINVNLVGTMRLTRALLPYIIESKGRIINISSVNDATVFPGLSVYSATKSGLSAFSRGLGYELRKFGASVVSLRLGDFARLTNIMQSHACHRDDMWNGMDASKRALYGNFFHEFHEHLMANYGMTSPRHYRESSLFTDARRALLAPRPPNSITCAPLGFRLFYAILELAPVWLQYHLLDLLFQFGFKWRAKTTSLASPASGKSDGKTHSQGLLLQQPTTATAAAAPPPVQPQPQQKRPSGGANGAGAQQAPARSSAASKEATNGHGVKKEASASGAAAAGGGGGGGGGGLKK